MHLRVYRAPCTSVPSVPSEVFSSRVSVSRKTEQETPVMCLSSAKEQSITWSFFLILGEILLPKLLLAAPKPW